MRHSWLEQELELAVASIRLLPQLSQAEIEECIEQSEREHPLELYQDPLKEESDENESERADD